MLFRSLRAQIAEQTIAPQGHEIAIRIAYLQDALIVALHGYGALGEHDLIRALSGSAELALDLATSADGISEFEDDGSVRDPAARVELAGFIGSELRSAALSLSVYATTSAMHRRQ